MSAPHSPRIDDERLAAVTRSMVALHVSHHDRKPVTAKTQPPADDLLVCVLEASAPTSRRRSSSFSTARRSRRPAASSRLP